jgi:hypothetical protein
MGIFVEWLEKRALREGTPAGWRPPVLAGQANPLSMAVLSIKKQLNKSPFDGNFTDSHVIQVTFNLSDQEMMALKQAGYIVKTPDGFNFDKAKIEGHGKQQTGVAPKPGWMTQPAAQPSPKPAAGGIAPKPGWMG